MVQITVSVSDKGKTTVKTRSKAKRGRVTPRQTQPAITRLLNEDERHSFRLRLARVARRAAWLCRVPA